MTLKWNAFELVIATIAGARVSTNPDMLVATTHWLYMTLRRLARDREAAAVLEPILEGVDIIENRDYHRLLLVDQGKLSADEVLAEAAETPATRSPSRRSATGSATGTCSTGGPGKRSSTSGG